jgi:APA family basic amino acid/polyamine antiporter
MDLKRTLNLFDATAIGVGAIIGAGIFVVLGIAIGYAGPAVILSIIIAGGVASFNAFSFAELGSAIPKEGGIYVYAYELLSPAIAFPVGCLWLFGQVVAGAAISLGFASYFVALFPAVSMKMVAIAAASLLTGLNLVGVKRSAMVNNLLVVVKIAILGLFIGCGVLQLQPLNFSEFNPMGFPGILQGAGFIFFAYLGFGRIAFLGEEVQNPERTVPFAVLLSLTIAIVVYVVTAFTAIGLQDYRLLAQSGSPIAEAAKATGNPLLVTTISVGALVATGSVLLTNLLGLSRVTFALARTGQLPHPVATLSSRFHTPYISILATGALMIVLVAGLDLRQTSAITSFSILATHSVLNVCALRLRKLRPTSTTFKAPFYPVLPCAGLLSCLILMFSLPAISWIAAIAVIGITSSLHVLTRKISTAA